MDIVKFAAFCGVVLLSRVNSGLTVHQHRSCDPSKNSDTLNSIETTYMKLPMGLSSNVCVDGRMYHPDPEDCRYFIQCSNGVPYRQPCAPTTYWSQRHLTCIRTSDHCGPSTTTSTTTTTTTTPKTTTTKCTSRETIATTPTTTTIVSSTTTTEEIPNTPTIPNTCDDTGVDYQPYPGNCKKYVQCLNGILTIYTCPKFQYWDTDLQACVYGMCRDESNTTAARETQIEYFASASEHNDSELTFDAAEHPESTFNAELIQYLITAVSVAKDNSTTAVEPTTAVVVEPPVITITNPKICGDGGVSFHPDPNNCTKFIQCLYGIPLPLSCPQYTHWDPIYGKCVVGECDDGLETTTTNPATTISTTSTTYSETTITEMPTTVTETPATETTEASPTTGGLATSDGSSTTEETVSSTVQLSSSGTTSSTTSEYTETTKAPATTKSPDITTTVFSTNSETTITGISTEATGRSSTETITTTAEGLQTSDGSSTIANPESSTVDLSTYTGSTTSSVSTTNKYPETTTTETSNGSSTVETPAKSAESATTESSENASNTTLKLSAVPATTKEVTTITPEPIVQSIVEILQPDGKSRNEEYFMVPPSPAPFVEAKLNIIEAPTNHESRTSATKTTPKTLHTEIMPMPKCQRNGEYLPDPADCRQFYKCNNGRPYQFACGGNLYWNYKINVCGWNAKNCYGNKG